MAEKVGAKNSNSQYTTIGCALMIVTVVLIISFVLIGQKETRLSDTKNDTAITLLDCKSDSPMNPFFVSGSAISFSHEIKITFKSEKPDIFSYNYYGTYNTEKLADTARSELHARYNIYMGENDLNQGSLYPTFNYNGANAKINLYGSIGDSLNQITARIFFLNSDEYEKLEQYTVDDLKRIYAEKGFTCQINK